MYSITINNQIYNYTTVTSRSKSLRLKVTGPNSFVVSSPRLVPGFLLNDFIRKNTAWIQKASANFHHYPDTSTLKTVNILGVDQPMQSEKKLKEKARILISDELEKLCIQFGFTYNRLSLKNTRTRFGSCSSRNNLNFNWQCIFFPYEIFRHLLLHELVHTQIKNHGPNFWAKLTQCDPNTKKNNAWLKTNGTKRYLFKP